MPSTDERELARAGSAIAELAVDLAARQRARALAERVFDVRSGVDAYDAVYARLAAAGPPEVSGPKRALRALALELGHLARVARRRSVVVLLYHRVLRSPDPNDPWSVRVSDLEDHMDVLASEGFRDVPLVELGSSDTPPRGKAVLIAFDDGYQSAVDHAVPVLLAARRTAAFFLVAGAMGRTSEWERGFGLTPSQIMSWETARQLLAAGISIGSHSMTHADLSAANDRSLAIEVDTSKDRLEATLGVRMSTFSVPFGRDDGRIDGHLLGSGYSLKLTNPFAASRHGTIKALAVSDIRQDDGVRGLRRHLSGAHDALYAYHRLRLRLVRHWRR